MRPRDDSLAARLANPDAVLTRTDLIALGYSRRCVDAIFRALPVEAWPGFGRPMIRVGDFHRLREQHTYRGDRVRPAGRRPTRPAR